jgi:membrane fusion protein (multidrug efflux system)
MRRTIVSTHGPARVRGLSFRALLAMGLAAGTLAAAGCGRTSASEAAAENAGKAPAAVEIGPENTVAVTAAEISVGPLISGELQATREATVRAEIGGAILQVLPEEGHRVAKGALLARIDARTLEDAVASAQSQLRSAEQSQQWADREAARIENLVKGGALAERDLEVARNQAIAAKAQVDDVKSRLAAARRVLEDATVRAPMAGIVAKRHVSAGDVVSPGGELYTIIDPSSMRLEASVPSEQLDAIRIGAAVVFTVRGYRDQSFEGRIERVSPAADAATRQVPIFVTIPNTSGRLVAGLFAEGRVTRESRKALVVPFTAVNENAGKPWVVRVRDGKAERLEVSLGLRDDQTERVEIASGVQAGDVLLIGASQGITPGTPLRIRNAS